MVLLAIREGQRCLVGALGSDESELALFVGKLNEQRITVAARDRNPPCDGITQRRDLIGAVAAPRSKIPGAVAEAALDKRLIPMKIAICSTGLSSRRPGGA